MTTSHSNGTNYKWSKLPGIISHTIALLKLKTWLNLEEVITTFKLRWLIEHLINYKNRVEQKKFERTKN